YTVDMLSTWQDGVTLDVNEEMMRLTLLIVAKTLFDADATADANRVAEVLDVIMEASNAVDFLPNWIPTRAHLEQKRALNDLDDIVYGYINDRRASGEDKGDLLSMLLMAEDEDGERMTDKQVRDEAVTLYLAGHETTSNAMTWTWYLLQQNPDAEAQLHAELDTVLQGRTPTMADLRNLPYTEMVIKESMRLLPPVFGVGRTAIADVDIDGYTIPAGSGVVLHFYRTHRHEEFWENPEKFDPQRFNPENEKSIPRYAYMPFSSGPRVCIGNSFAMMEAELLLATIAQQYTLRRMPMLSWIRKLHYVRNTGCR
ncbi:MAG: cytochrome P450, partial [Aggregatilineales bacterium]